MNRTASVVRAMPIRATGSAAIVGGDMPARGEMMRLLTNAGFRLRGEPEAAALLIVAGHVREDERLRQIRALSETHAGARIVAVMPGGASNSALRRTLLAGACGIVLEADAERALVPTARAVLAGQLAVPTVLAQQIAPRPLSHREKQILALVVLGMTNREIANKLFLAESTVKTHLSSAFRKIDARSRSEAVARIQDPESGVGRGVMAVINGITDSPDALTSPAAGRRTPGLTKEALGLAR